MANINASFSIKIGDKVYTFKGLTDNDIAKLKQALADITSLEEALSTIQNTLASANKAQATLAYKDLAQVDNQADMQAGVYYKVPYNKAGQFIAIDPETGKISETQGEGVSDTTIDHFDIYFKSDKGSVTLTGSEDFRSNFDDFATLSGANAFVQTPTITAEQVAESIQDNEVPKAVTVKALAQSIAEAEAGEVLTTIEGKNFAAAVTSEFLPEEGSMADNTFYLVPATDLLAD